MNDGVTERIGSEDEEDIKRLERAQGKNGKGLFKKIWESKERQTANELFNSLPKSIRKQAILSELFTQIQELQTAKNYMQDGLNKINQRIEVLYKAAKKLIKEVDE